MMAKKNSLNAKKTRETITMVRKERDEVKEAFAELSGIHESSVAESHAMLTKLQLENAALKANNEALTKEVAEKQNAIDKILELYNNLVTEWHSVPKWQRFFVALSYITKFVSLLGDVITQPIDETA